MLTSIWENSTTVLQYPYCQNIHDGRGYTSGRAGFCSGTGDAIQVVQCFDTAFGTANNPMAKYMPALTTINDRFNSTGNNQGSTAELDAVGNYCSDWTKTTNDAATSTAFKACQDQITTLLYFEPGLAQARKWGLVTALTIAELYDAEINHGDDGVTTLVKQANIDTGNSAQHPPSAPLSQAQESTWLHAFLMRRLALLKSDPTWAKAEDRVTTYEQLRLDNNFDLSAQIRTNAKAITMYPGQGYMDSGYPDCIIAPNGAVSGDASCTSPVGQ
jgi:chitosanase